MSERNNGGCEQLTKIGSSTGSGLPRVVDGEGLFAGPSKVRLPEKRIEAESGGGEVERFLQAIRESREQLTEIKDKVLDSRSRRHAFILMST